jgi:arginase family enzyme
MPSVRADAVIQFDAHSDLWADDDMGGSTTAR